MSTLKVGRPSRREKAIKAVQEDVKIRMNVNIEKTFYKSIKQFALDNDTTVSDVVIKSLEQYIGKSK